MADPGSPCGRVGLPISYTTAFRFCSRMDDAEELVAGYFHFMRSQRRRKPVEWTPDGQRLMRAIELRAENERRRALRQARLEWAEDRDAWEHQWR
ncbi:hypothetical protein [Sphingomonas parapaucimobilis]|uniref:Uncharacterized protein n=1 Tax=Sphingomonas parapaucimobilis NBRC 15100 TaxID=1219049 RepID=A0A0A1W5W2_9SPHN|nr:hypothetical protein [Sphingomonas parapaucimobilis]GAM00546.1 hypothetical protein SP5_034_01200 [Sphingomonas parapaucimobilis NBRC 15100]